VLVELGSMSKVEREEHTWFGLYLWERKYIKRRNQTAIILRRWIYSNAG
jgi:hypothetical protein